MGFSTDIDIPSIDEIEENGFADTIKNIYVAQKPLFLVKYPSLKHYSDDKIVSYVSLYIIANEKLLGSFSTMKQRAIMYRSATQRALFIYRFFRENIDSFCLCLNEYDQKTEVSVKREYYENLKEYKKEFFADEKLQKFMNDNPNPNMLNAIRTYFLSHDLDLSILGIEVTSDNLFAYAMNYVYRKLQEATSIKFCGTMFKTLKIKKYIADLSSDECKEFVDRCMQSVKKYTMTEDEYIAFFNRKAGIAKSIIRTEMIAEEQQRVKKEN